jgi:hypothetical protein
MCVRSLLRLLAVVTAAGGLVACSGNSSEPSAKPSTPTTLVSLHQRPIHIPHLNVGEPCPVSRPRTLSPAFAPGLGDGPVCPVGFAKRSVLAFEYPPPKNSLFAGSDWGGQKVLWVSNLKYDGPILIRGTQIDGTNRLRFGLVGPTILEELAFPPSQRRELVGRMAELPFVHAPASARVLRLSSRRRWLQRHHRLQRRGLGLLARRRPSASVPTVFADP